MRRMLQMVSVTFEELSMEASDGCSRDMVLVGDSDDSLLGRFCGADVPSTITSTGSSLSVYFMTGRENNEGRFAFSWTFVSQSGQGK